MMSNKSNICNYLSITFLRIINSHNYILWKKKTLTIKHWLNILLIFLAIVNALELDHLCNEITIAYAIRVRSNYTCLRVLG